MGRVYLITRRGQNLEHYIFELPAAINGRVINVIDKPVFEPFKKIPRLFRHCIVTEKLDGTNVQIYIDNAYNLLAGSRNRWLSTDVKSNDHYDFARWCELNRDELITLGPGRHYGEWWGCGINRGYDLSERRFSLFNTSRVAGAVPKCCSVVPVLSEGDFSTIEVSYTLCMLQQCGSRAAPGYMEPEGIVVYHTASNQYFKVTLENDDKPKGV